MDKSFIATHDFLLNSPGIEVACRPCLYPWASYGDTDHSHRLKALGRMADKATPSMRYSFMRKINSRVAIYSMDFKLQSLIYDIHLATHCWNIVCTAIKKKMSVDSISDNSHWFDTYWKTVRGFSRPMPTKGLAQRVRHYSAR